MLIGRPDCPACASPGMLLFRAPYSEVSRFLSDYYRRPIALTGDYTVRRCGTCGTYYQGEVPDEALAGKLYGDWLEGPADIVNDRDRGEIRLASAFLGKPKLRTLDYGMGTGVWAIASRELGHSSYGYEHSPKLMAEARSHGILTDDSGDMDFINTEQVFEHLPDPRGTARELAGRLRRGGILKISVPSQKTTAKAISRLRAGEPMAGWVMPVQPLEHLNNFSRKGLKMMAADCGLEPVRPGLLQQYRTTARTPKELLRPIYRWLSPGNTYMWFRKV